MKRRLISIAVTLILGMTSSSGCLWAPELEKLRTEIQVQIPEARFDKEIAVTLGPVAIRLARLATRFIPEAREAREYLSGLRRLELAMYKTQSLPSLAQLRLPERLRKLTTEEGWQIAVKVRQDSEVIWILSREKNEKIESVYLVVLNDEDLIIARLKGNLEQLAFKAIGERDLLPQS